MISRVRFDSGARASRQAGAKGHAKGTVRRPKAEPCLEVLPGPARQIWRLDTKANCARLWGCEGVLAPVRHGDRTEALGAAAILASMARARPQLCA